MMQIEYKNKIFNVDVSGSPDHQQIIIDGKLIDFTYGIISEHQVQININGRNLIACIASDKDRIYVDIDGMYFIFKKIEVSSGDKFGTRKDPGAGIIKAPMPGTIVKTFAKIGQKVDDGSPILIMESMKMETTIYSTLQGIISEVNISAGDKVDTDMTLVVINKEEEVSFKISISGT